MQRKSLKKLKKELNVNRYGNDYVESSSPSSEVVSESLLSSSDSNESAVDDII